MKRGINNDSASDDDVDIFQYGNKTKLKFNQHVDIESSSSDESDGSEEDSESESECKDDSQNFEIQRDTKRQKIILEDDFLSPPPPPTIDLGSSMRSNKVKPMSQLLNQLKETNYSPLSVIQQPYIDSPQKMLVKIRCHGILEKFELCDNEPFQCVFERIAKRENTDPSNVSLMHLTKNVLPTETIAMIRLTVADILDCFVHSSIAEDEYIEAEKENLIKLRLQGQNDKRSLHLTIDLNAKLKVLIDKYANLVDYLDKDKVKFYFDGEVMDVEKTPAELDMCNDDVIDVVMP